VGRDGEAILRPRFMFFSVKEKILGFTWHTMYYVYFLESLQDKSHYIGYSPDLKKRLLKHNNKQVPSTKRNAPWKLIYYEAYLNRKDATGREKFLKSGSGWRFLKKQLFHYFYVSP
jgi:putative endonuclease